MKLPEDIASLVGYDPCDENNPDEAEAAYRTALEYAYREAIAAPTHPETGDIIEIVIPDTFNGYALMRVEDANLLASRLIRARVLRTSAEGMGPDTLQLIPAHWVTNIYRKTEVNHA